MAKAKRVHSTPRKTAAKIQPEAATAQTLDAELIELGARFEPLEIYITSRKGAGRVLRRKPASPQAMRFLRSTTK